MADTQWVRLFAELVDECPQSKMNRKVLNRKGPGKQTGYEWLS